MHRRQLLEYNVPDRLNQALTVGYTGVPQWGGELQAVINNAEIMAGRRGAEYTASVMASRMRENEVLVTIKNDPYFVSSSRENNRPTVTKLEDLDNYEQRLNDLSYKMLLPPYWAAKWIRQEPEGSILHTVGQQQEDRRRSPTVTAVPSADISSNGGVDNNDNGVTVATDDSGEIIGQVDLPNLGTTGPAATFADSNKRGIANNPEEEEAILEIQTFLSDTLGLDVGRNGPDKIYGPRTVEAVKILQQAINKIGDNNIKVDGDAGPMTISGMLAINQDFEKIAELTAALENNISDSFVKIIYKSKIAQLLEQTLVEDTRSELENLIAKYKDLLDSTILPDNAPIRTIVNNAETKMITIDAGTALGTDTTSTAATAAEPIEGPYKAGDEITDDIAAKLTTLGIDPGMGGEPMTQEDADALNKGIADGTIEPEVEPEVVEPNYSSGNSYSFDDEFDFANNGKNLEPGTRVNIPGADGTIKQFVITDDGKLTLLQPTEPEAGTGEVEPVANDWKDVTSGSEMIDGYSLWRKEADEWAQTINGEQPTDATEEYTNPAMAIAAARRAKNAQEAEAKRIEDEAAAEAEAKRIADQRTAALTQIQSTNTKQAQNYGVQLHDLLDSGILGYTNVRKQQEIIRIIQSIETKELYQVADAAFKNVTRRGETILGWLKDEQWDTKPAFDHVRSLGISESINDSVIHTLARLNTVLGVNQ